MTDPKATMVQPGATPAASGMRRVRMARAERREQIVESARDVFATYGLAGTGIRQLAEGAGVDSALLYHYFSSKDEIFEAAVLDPLRDLVATITELCERMAAGPPLDRAAELVETGLVTMVRLFRESLPLLGMVLFGGDEMGRQFFIEHLKPMISQSYEAGFRAIDGWVERPPHPAMATAIFGMCFLTAVEQHFTCSEIDEAGLGPVLRDFVLHGLSAPKT
jgi:AcrR family transcriptional regulator